LRDLIVDPLENRDGMLHVGGVSAVELADRYGTPLYAIVEDRIRANYRRLVRAFRERYPDTRVHYALKANTNLAVLSILRQEGAGADCSCPAEIDLARRAGFLVGQSAIGKRPTTKPRPRASSPLPFLLSFRALDSPGGEESACRRLLGKAGPSTALGMTEKGVRFLRFLRKLRIWGGRFWPRNRAPENKRPQKTQKPQKP